MICEYIGIRPALDYPNCPEHTEKQIIWDLLEVEQRIGMKHYFALGCIDEDQAVDYAKRKSWGEKEVVKWLGVLMK